MLRVGGRRIILEPDVVRDVVGDVAADHGAERAALAAGGAVRIHGLQIETAREAAPGEVGCIQQIADVLAGEDRGARRARTDVKTRIDVTGQCKAALTIGDGATVSNDRLHAVGLAGDDVDRAGRRRTVAVGVGVVVERVVLGIIPHRSDGVAVKIAHHLALGAERAGRARCAAARVQREEIGLAVVIGLLLGRVGVALRLGVRLRPVDTERIGGIGAVRRVGEVSVVVQQKRIRREVVDAWHRMGGIERRFAGRVARLRIGREVVIERNIFAEDHDKMLDRSGGSGRGCTARQRVRGNRTAARGRNGERRHSGE